MAAPMIVWVSESKSIFPRRCRRLGGEYRSNLGRGNAVVGKLVVMTAFIVFTIWQTTSALAQSIDWSGMDGVLRSFSTPVGVDYRRLKADRAGLDQFLVQVRGVSSNAFDNWPREEQIAYLINAYNAIVLQQVVDDYPIKRSSKPAALLRPANSVWQIDGFFNELRHRVAGRNLTLDQIEHEWLRRRYREPRIHFALVCAARACPPLRREAYRADRLNEQLDEQARAFLNDRARNRFEHQRAELSEIFKWFAEDFGGERGLRAYLGRYLNSEWSARVRSETYGISYVEYDWTLNDVTR